MIWLHLWQVPRWPRLVLRGDEHVIPRICPACLAPGDHPVISRYTRRLANLGFAVNYVQTFYYCAACGKVMEGYFHYYARAYMLGAVAYVGAIALGLTLASAVFERETALWWIPAVVGVVAAWGGMRLLRTKWIGPPRLRGLPRHPAAYYTGAAFVGKGNVYRALRPEWLRRLAEANPRSVDEKSLARTS